MPKLFERPEFKQFEHRWNTRFNELQRRHAYYTGAIYDQWSPMNFGSFNYSIRNQIYAKIRPLYLPLSRAVDIDSGIIPGDWALDLETPDNIIQLVEEIFNVSNWNTEGVLYIHYGSIYGTSVLKMSDDRESRQVTIHPIRPTQVMLIEDELSIQLEDRTDPFGEIFEYAEVITKDEVMTFKDGIPFGYDDREPFYRNELVFIPFIEIPHINVGKGIGDSTYQRSMALLDEVNEHASYLSDVIKKHAEPQWAAFNVKESDLEKDGGNIWFMNKENARIEPIVPQIDITGVLEFVREIRDQVVSSLPELAFDELTGKDQIATATVELQLMELILKIKRTRPNYDDGLESIFNMIARSGLGYDQLFDAVDFDQNRPILPPDPMRQLEIRAKEIEVERLENVTSNDIDEE